MKAKRLKRYWFEVEGYSEYVTNAYGIRDLRQRVKKAFGTDKIRVFREYRFKNLKDDGLILIYWN